MQGFDVSALMGDEELQAWVDFSDEVKVLLRHVSREKISKILKQATVTSFDRSHQKQSEVDNLKYGELIGKAAIVDWQGLVAAGGPLPCNPENINILMRRWGDFAKFVSDTCSDLEQLVAAEKESVRKNSENTSALEVIIRP